jgi:ATP-dependent helicase HrpA
VAKRIAEELSTPLGEVVGFKVRFQDRLSRDASVKLMTDGILLAETQTDPLLKAYDTLIIDEAHERSLNIDFLLGYLRQILPRRPDLKIVVTSATIDADRFATHFASRHGPAPIIMVSGRMFPVEQRYRPFEESREYDLNNAIADAVDELWRGIGPAGQPSGPGQDGDILVFLPGEREIREAADHLRKHLSHQPVLRHAEVLPLFARLSQAEQDRIFDSHGSRRIVLATNVAETSLTVPGIRFVVDAGTARMKRYSFRSKVEQLLVEPISQSSANQRAGRCGRVANGICIRLYDAAGLRPARAVHRPGDPAQLAGRRDPAHEVAASGGGGGLPVHRAAPGACDRRRLPVAGRARRGGRCQRADTHRAELARLPLDPRVGRMILEARARQALDEVLVIASALSVQDVRDRPMDAQAAADAAHVKFDDERSEFTGYLKLWKWIAHARGEKGSAEHRLSNRQYEQLLRQNFVSVRRVREWKDIHSQLHTVVAEHKWPINTAPPPTSRSTCRCWPACWAMSAASSTTRMSTWARAASSSTAIPARTWPRSPAAGSWRPNWWRRRGCSAAASRKIEPAWIEQVGGHLLKKQLLDPHWEKKAAEVTALERATLYGIVVYNGRRVNFSRVDPQAHARSSSARRWSPASGRRSCLSWRPTTSSSARWRTWSTSRAARTCWSTTN